MYKGIWILLSLIWLHNPHSLFFLIFGSLEFFLRIYTDVEFARKLICYYILCLKARPYLTLVLSFYIPHGRILAPSTAMKRATENKYLANLKTDIVEKALKYDRKEKMKEVIHEADDIPEEGFVLEPTGHGNGKQFRLPHSLYDVLHTYQKEGIKWLWTLHLKKLGGALCDEMGMGKTRQVNYMQWFVL